MELSEQLAVCSATCLTEFFAENNYVPSPESMGPVFREIAQAAQHLVLTSDFVSRGDMIGLVEEVCFLSVRIAQQRLEIVKNLPTVLQ